MAYEWIPWHSKAGRKTAALTSITLYDPFRSVAGHAQ